MSVPVAAAVMASMPSLPPVSMPALACTVHLDLDLDPSVNTACAHTRVRASCRAVYSTGEACRNVARYVFNDDVFCGMHTSSRVAATPTSAGETRQRQRADAVERNAAILDARACNRAAGRRGTAVLARTTRARLVHQPGCVAVFTHARHETRGDGVTCAELSPMRVGPIAHGQPGLPDARTLENLHQYSKRFAGETDAQFAAARHAGYTSTVARRRKAPGRVPLHAVWLDDDGAEMRLDALQARRLFCTFYAHLVCGTPAFARLVAMLDDGFDLELVGSDARAMPLGAMAAYASTQHAFRHERILHTMLTCDQSAWPWLIACDRASTPPLASALAPAPALALAPALPLMLIHA